MKIGEFEILEVLITEKHKTTYLAHSGITKAGLIPIIQTP